MLAVLGYLGVAVAGGVAPRLSLGSGSPDARAFAQGIRYLLLLQGLAVAPLVVWAKPVIDLVFGPGYESSVEVLQVLSVGMFVTAPAALLSLSVTYLGEARRRVRIVLWTLLLGVVVTYALIQTLGLVGAAVADDVVAIAYLSANLWICTRLISVDLRGLAWSLARTVMAMAAMAVPLLLLGTDHLSLIEWIVGLVAGVAAYVATLLLTREISIAELRSVGGRVLIEVRPKSSPAPSADQ
jgi:O-antigen/teichoic acid export membrane protein